MTLSNIRACILALLLMPIVAFAGEKDYSHILDNYDRQTKCLAVALYHEARGESINGQRAVADVIINRAIQSGKSVCKVIKTRGQFSWDTSKVHQAYPKKIDTQHEKARKVMAMIAMGTWESTVGNAMFFLSGNVMPAWAKKMRYVKRVDGHRFYAPRKTTNIVL